MSDTPKTDEVKVPYRLSPADIYEFAGWLTTRSETLIVGAEHKCYPIAEAVGEYLKAFPERFTAPRELAAVRAELERALVVVQAAVAYAKADGPEAMMPLLSLEHAVSAWKAGWAFWRPIGELEMQNILMKFDPATGEERPYPSHAAQWREWHGGTAWLFDPWTGRRRDARDVGSDVHGLLIVPAGTLGMDMGGGCSEKDNVACA